MKNLKGVSVKLNQKKTITIKKWLSENENICFFTTSDENCIAKIFSEEKS